MIRYITYKDYFIRLNDNWTIGSKYCFFADGYDGAPDSSDFRCGYGDTIEDCIKEIDEQIVHSICV